MIPKHILSFWLALNLPLFLTAAPNLVPLQPFSASELASRERLPTGEDTGAMRALLCSPALESQRKAAAALVVSGDAPSIARLVYALRQGSVDAAQLLFDYPSINTVPYLIEDIQRGSRDALPGDYAGDDVTRGFPSVRDAAAKIVLRCIGTAPDLPESAHDWVKKLNQAGLMVADEDIQDNLIVWWIHNAAALKERRYRDASWVPSIRLISETPSAIAALIPPPPAPSPPTIATIPMHVSESFAEWSRRIKSMDVRIDLPQVSKEKLEAAPVAQSSSSAGTRTPDLSFVSERHNSDSSNFAIGLIIAVALGLLWLLLRRRS